MDPQVKGKRYRSCDEVVDMLKDNFVGQIGMRIMQRPKSDKLFETEKDKQEFMNKTFIENVWCFSKDKNFDLFSTARKEHLIVSFHKYYDGNITKRLQQPKKSKFLSKKNRITNLYDEERFEMISPVSIR